jgi:hypothetical protein
MNPTFLLALSFLFPQSLPTQTGPIRNTFAVAVETVIDNATAVDIKAEDPTFNVQFQQLKSSRDNLNNMAYDDREKDIANAASNMVFLITACHIQAKDGADISKCLSQFLNARNRLMESIDKHKTSGGWIDGPPLVTTATATAFV